MNCALCGYKFDKNTLSCHASCPLAHGCHILCCPNCGYQVVDEAESETVRLLLKVKEKLVRWPSKSAAG